MNPLVLIAIVVPTCFLGMCVVCCGILGVIVGIDEDTTPMPRRTGTYYGARTHYEHGPATERAVQNMKNAGTYTPEAEQNLENLERAWRETGASR